MYTKADLRAIFQTQYNESSWKEILRDFFHADGLRPTPQDLGEEDGNHGYFLGQSATKLGLTVGFFYYRIEKGNVLRKRVGLRKLIKPYLDLDVEAAVAVFQDDKHWRLSFISDFKGATTTPKRFTYVFGEASQFYNTPVNRLFDLKDKELTLENLHDTFSVEALSDEFFKEYKAQYEKFCNYLYKHRNNTSLFGAEFAEWDEKLLRDYVKKMMGRLVFLQFVQKKGWLGDNANYLRSMFANYPNQDDFLDQVLEPLFFGIFNTQPADRLERFNIEGWNTNLLNEWKDVPFLSGGLFDQDKLDSPSSKFPKDYFKDLFDFFASYNFTIDENDPNDAEIGVDPEMLGKIFENLLEDNKDKGAFYTPKEIVHYMSCESIIQYLKTHTDESLHADIEALVNHSEISEDSHLREGKVAKQISQLLKDVKVCDPAIGSGAFPMGVLNVIYNCRRALHEANSTEEINTVGVKKQIIQNNIYGVDIEQGAVDIARLRFWLALLVDAKEPESLPNLNYKIMRGNSLITTFDGQYLDLSIQGNDGDKAQKLKELYTLQSSFYSKVGDEKMRDEIRIKQLILDIVAMQIGKEIRIWEEKHTTTGCMFEKRSYDDLKNILPEEKVSALKKGESIRQKLNDESCSLQERASTDLDFFDWKIMFSDVFENKGGFDIVIGNPPYIDSESMTNQGMGELRDILKKQHSCLEGNWDMYMAFLEFSLSVAKTVVFITPDKWLSKPFGKKFRGTRMVERMSAITRAGSKVFENATIDAIITLFISKSDKLSVNEFESEKNVVKITSKGVHSIKDLQDPFIIDYLFADNIDVIIKMDAQEGKVKDLAECEGACATSDAYKLRPYISDVSTPNYKDDYIVINTGTISKYYNRWGTSPMKYLGNSYLCPTVKRSDFNSNFGSTYVRRASRPKVIFKGLNLLDVCLDKDAIILPAKTTNVICSEDIDLLKFLCGLLNSKLVFYYIKLKYSSSSYCGGITFTKDMINYLPVSTTADRSLIVEIVDKIISVKEQNPLNDTSDLEAQLDKQVYKLYNLSPEEIIIVENASK